jgi:hypothetical protein
MTVAARVTQRLPADALPDLLDHPRRAALAVASPTGPVCLPVLVRCEGDALLVGVDAALLPEGPAPERGTLLVDAGAYWFQLRAIVRRGSLTGLDRSDRDDDARQWFAFETRSQIAWDYGRLHREPAS